MQFVTLRKPALLLLAAAAAAPRATAFSPSQEQTLHPVADGRVYQTNPLESYGHEPLLRVRKEWKGAYQSFLRFSVPDVEVQSATLRLYCTDGSPDGGVLYLVQDNGWTEDDLTWDTQPRKIESVLALLGNVSADSWVELDVTSAVTGPGPFVLGLGRGSGNSAYYSAREGVRPAELVLSTSGGGGDEVVAGFSAKPVSGQMPLEVTFTDESSGTIGSWSWSFGDGDVSAKSDPVHVYEKPGVYDVTLTVSGPAGSDSHTVEGLVHVFEPGVQGIWTSAHELASLPTSGAAWNSLLAVADEPAGTPDVSDQDDDTDVRVLAKALVFARTGQQAYRAQVVEACWKAIGTEVGGRTLALGRNLAPYVIAADLVGLPADVDQAFRSWLYVCLSEVLEGRTLRSTHEDRANNWGTHAGASRVAAAVYLGDQPELERCAEVFKGWLGDRDSYAGFDYGDLDWQADPTKPVGINPAGATKGGHSIDGVLPDDQRRSGGFTWPPPKENYVWEALQGALVQAVILHRAGYDVWDWEDEALLRAAQWLHDECEYPASGDDTWLPHVINHYYGTSFPAPAPSNAGKNMGWTDWTHSGPP